ncbi:M24 family metallopeptidase [Tenuibacillus multivorans]|uniref:Xaa-Pro aminopeptidase n=1 Tax=Tenuibacillus multivorans TaxID=237069 RepID=A0A1G9Z888_9BACI|nr:Xaa-Pro peptidase family protein [Tenuibacillus multivorans]GEL77358.1 Xaa-Pro dipeptidase [Tenuibacillus multivorans]SDN17530.1 Xaa-Pro aminopeptidase [Tenuibacillus multivorans]
MLKLDKLRQKLTEKDLDGFLITNGQNRRYMTGFTGTAGVVLVTNDESLFITDFRYTVQANEQVKDFKIIEHKGPIHLEVAEQAKRLGIKRLGFEKDSMTYALYETYEKEISSEFIPTSGLIETLRLIKSEDEIKVLKEAAEIADAAFDHIQTVIKPGVKEIDVSNELEFYMRKQGAASSSFDIIVASGYRSALPHGVASDKEIQSGELVTLDFGALYNGYCSDITRTLAVGQINDQLQEIYDTVLQAQLKGMEGTKSGITGKEADALTRDYIKEKGYGEYFGHSTGHGLGMDVHEGPGLSYRSDKVLEPGMVVTIEPGIYVPDVGGCRIEDDIVITENGNETLTFSPKELITL